MRDSDAPDGQQADPAELFTALRGAGPDPEDSERTWQRIEAALPSRRSVSDDGGRQILTGPWGPVWRFASVAAAALVVGMVGAGILLWSTPAPRGQDAAMSPERGVTAAEEPPSRDPAAGIDSGAADGGEMVLLTPPSLVAEAPGEDAPAPDRAGDADANRVPDARIAAVPELQGWELDVRLIRGHDGAAPADALVDERAGAGGASRLRDLRGTLEALLPFGRFALVGQWTGPLEADGGELRATLSDTYRLDWRARSAGDGDRLLLEGVRLQGAGVSRGAGPMTLVPGQLYLLGVRGEPADSGLVLAVRARRVTDPDARN